MYPQISLRLAIWQRNKELPRFLTQATWSWRYVIEPLDLNEAIDRIVSGIEPLPGEELVDLDTADNRVAARDVIAAVDLPPFPSSAMDGIAVAASALAGAPPFELKIVGDSRAGHPFTAAAPLAANDCIRIFTGASLPPELDCVVIQEDCEFHRDQPYARATTHVRPEPGANVRPVGHDVAAGERIISAGERLNAFSVGWLSACGETKVAVRQRPKVSIFATGDELREPGGELEPGAIFESNRILLRRMLARLPVEVADLGILPDDPAVIHDALLNAAANSDLLITSAGVSVGEADFVTDVLQRIGTLEIWRLLIKPGKPLAFGRIKDCLFFGLPGNPVSTAVTYLTVAQPALLKLCGANRAAQPEFLALLADDVQHKPGREEFQRGVLEQSGEKLIVRITGDQSSNRLASFHAANCLIRIPKAEGDLAAGTQVRVLPLGGIL